LLLYLTNNSFYTVADFWSIQWTISLNWFCLAVCFVFYDMSWPVSCPLYFWTYEMWNICVHVKEIPGSSILLLLLHNHERCIKIWVITTAHMYKHSDHLSYSMSYINQQTNWQTDWMTDYLIN
jgi:hypothetical protein